MKSHSVFDNLVKYCVPFSDITPTVHRVLCHGNLFLKEAQDLGIPLGCFSESGLEMRNKDRRKGRLNFARKTSRLNNIRDTYQYLMHTSDPYINSLKLK